MNLSLVPQPRKIEFLPGTCAAAAPLTSRLQPMPGGREAYALEIGADGIRIAAESDTGLFYAERTLAQIRRQAGAGPLPCLKIEDRPSLAQRGVSYDISRGRVPSMEALRAMIDGLAELKVNQLQLYTEHTFAFEAHPLIGKDCSPLTAAEIRALDDYCAERHIELVPSLASFGHMHKVLEIEGYQGMAEDLAAAKYVSPETDWKRVSRLPKGWTLAPLREESYAFLDSLYREYLPLFRSKRFNACCDETFDLGWGQSYEACKELGLGEVFARHILRLRELALKYGKTETMIWGDVLHSHPVILERLPKDVTVLDWNYNEAGDFEKIAIFTRAGLTTYACPSTNSWGSLFPRLPFAAMNVQAFGDAAKAAGAQGLLNTVWGDGGHFNFLECEWHGLARGAEKGWNLDSGNAGFSRRFCAAFLGLADPAFASALDRLGELATLVHVDGGEWFWTSVFFAPPGSDLFKTRPRSAYFAEAGQVTRSERELGPEWGTAALKALGEIRPVLEAGFAGNDFRELGGAWLFSLDCMAFAAERWATQDQDPDALARRMSEIRARFVALWREKNRESEIQITLKRYDAVIEGLRQAKEKVSTKPTA
jgi:hypothetical protein